MPPKRGRKRNVKSKSLAKDDKQLKEREINFVCSSIDLQIKRRLKNMTIDLETVATFIRSIYVRETARYTEKVQAMTVKEFFNQGEKNLALNSAKEEIKILSDNVSSILSDIQRRRQEGIVWIPKDDRKCVKSACSGTKSKRVGKVAGKPSTKTKRVTKSQTHSSNPVSTSLSTRTVLQPITPKFDPSLPTPRARKPRFGEVLLSLAGSPISSQLQSIENKSNVVVSVERGKMIMSIPEKMDEVQIDDTTKESLMKVKNKLDKLLQC